MGDLFFRVLDMSLSASWVVLAVLLARLLMRRAPKWMMCALWALVALRLLCPFSPESNLSLMPEHDLSRELPTAEVEPSPPSAYGEILSSDGEVLVTRPLNPEPVSPAPEIERAYGEILSSDGEVLVSRHLKSESGAAQNFTWLWPAGMLLMAVYAAVSYLRIHRKVRASIELGNGTYLCDYIDTPFILGIFRPRIYLPSEMDPADAAHVLAHEKAHLKRRDHLWKPLGYLLLTVHWFNPLLWLAYILLCRDIELACDEKVIRNLDIPEKKAYSEALLKCSVPRRLILACPLAFGEVGVKQRIRSVLHYKKPGFWILLIGAVLILTIAVCFLSDPQSPTLANILEIREEEIVSIHLWGRKGRATFETKEEISEFLNFLDKLEYDPVPAASEPITGLLDEHDWSYETIVFQYERSTDTILMDYDYALVWTMDADGNVSLPYRMKDSSILQEYLHDHVTPVVNREVYAEPFARQDQPAQWLRGIHMDALRTANYYDSTNNYLSNAQTAKVIDVLNRIPESAISGERYMENFSFGEHSSAAPSVVLTDDANGLTGILHYFDGNTELALMQTRDYEIEPWDGPRGPATIWKIESKELRSLFEELYQNPPDVIVFMGARYNFHREKEVISDGNTTISARILEDWDYEIIHPEDGEDFFGFRCRPKTESEGWVTFSWWEDGFIPLETEQKVQTNMYGYHYTYTSTGNDSSDHYLRAHCSHGDFVISYEKTNTWTKKHQEDANCIDSFVDITCELKHQHTEIPESLLSYLENVAYYDWDAIARELGTQNLALFDVQYSGEYLFVGLSHDGAYHIACFRQVEAYDYTYVQLLEPVVKSLPSVENKTAAIVEFEDADSKLHLYIIDDETATGIECHSGFEAYLHLNNTPSLVVLDESLWENSTVAFDLRYEDVPALYFLAPSNGSAFEFNPSPQYYLYDCLVNYNDGKHTPGSYSMDAEELWDLTEVLLSLPEAQRIFVPIDEAPNFDVTKAPEGSSSVYLDLRLSSCNKYWWSEYGIFPEELGSIQLELYYCDGTVTLGVNMRELDRNVYRDYYYFEIESPELEEYFQSICDVSRKAD